MDHEFIRFLEAMGIIVIPIGGEEAIIDEDEVNNRRDKVAKMSFDALVLTEKVLGVKLEPGTWVTSHLCMDLGLNKMAQEHVVEMINDVAERVRNLYVERFGTSE